MHMLPSGVEKAMGRPREFDVDQVLSEAMEVFWEKGFEGASFADIEARTGVRKASLFAAYGDKRELFLKAIGRYQEAGREACRANLQQGTPKQAVRRWMEDVAGLSKGACGKRGCFQVNTIVELAPHDDAVADLVREHASALTEVLADAVRRGQASGDFRTDMDARILATYVIASVYGLSVAGKTSLPDRDIDAIVRIVLSALEA